MRGSGPKGLAAMPPGAPLLAGRLIRPLLEHSRAELLDYARRHDLDWLEDPSNRDLGFDRNFLRHQVLPLLAERWPACAASIARSAAHCAEAQGLVDLVAEDEMVKAAGQRRGTLSIDRLLNLKLPARKAVVRHWLREQHQSPPDARHLDRILTEVLVARPDANPLVAWRGCEVRRYRGDLLAMRPLPPVPAPDPIRWVEGVLSLSCGLGSLELLAVDGRSLDPRALFADGLEVRFGVHGLSCRPPPGRHRRPLKKLFQENGVPPWVRPFVPLIFARTDLVAVGDLWTCRAEGAAMNQVFRIRWKSDLPTWSGRDFPGA